MSLHMRCGALEAVLRWAMLYIMLSVRRMVVLITLFLFSTGAEGAERNHRRNGTIWFKTSAPDTEAVRQADDVILSWNIALKYD